MKKNDIKNYVEKNGKIILNDISNEDYKYFNENENYNIFKKMNKIVIILVK